MKSQTFPHYFRLWILQNFDKSKSIQHVLPLTNFSLMNVFNSLEEAGWKLCSHISIIFTNRKLHVLKIRLPNSKLHYCLQIYNERLFLKIINNVFYLIIIKFHELFALMLFTFNVWAFGVFFCETPLQKTYWNHLRTSPNMWYAQWPWFWER